MKRNHISYPVFLCVLLFIQSLCFAELSDDEIEFFRNKGIQPFIAEDQDGDYSKGIYLVPHNLFIEKGKVMTIYPGSTILFKKDTKIQVFGKLVCLGNEHEKVIFRKLDNDQYYNSYEDEIETRWDGIYIADSAELEMSYTTISDSKYGISSSIKASILTLDSVLFVNNKYHNATVDTKELEIVDSKPFFYNITTSRPSKLIFSPPETTTVVKTIVIPNSAVSDPQPQPHKTSQRKIHVRVFSGTVMLTGALMGGGGYLLSRLSYQDYKKNTNDPKEAKKDRIKDLIGQTSVLSGGIIGTLGLSGLVLTLLF